MPKKRKQVFWKSLFDDDVWNETGKAIAYAIPTATVLTIIYQLIPPLFQYLSGTADAESITDIFAHTFAAAGITGFVFALVRKHKEGPWHIRRHAKLIAIIAALIFMIPIWETIEVQLGLLATEDIKKDIVSDMAGVLSYVLLEPLRRKIKNG
jgi:uncharacterized membrane protein HdeD (DUF308 family)